MASWVDGPEYAPLQRPAAFDVPAAPPLEEVPPEARPAAGAPVERPRFDLPPRPVAPLAELVPQPSDQRDPAVPFAVVASTLTSMDSAWGAAHRTAGAPAAAATPAVGVPGAVPPWPGPAPVLPGGTVEYLQGAGVPPPYPPPAGGYPPPAGFPPPGTPQWFGPGPGPGAGALPPAPRTDLRAVVEAATPGLLICLVVGALLTPLSLVALLLGAGLSRRAKVAERELAWVFGGALGFLGLVFLARLLSVEALYTDWWTYLGGWSLVLCWVVLILVLVLVRRALVRSGIGRGPQPPSWG